MGKAGSRRDCSSLSHHNGWQRDLLSVSSAGGRSCIFRNKGKKFDIQEGEVTSVKKDKVRVCENGKLVKKDRSEVPTPFKIGCNGCVWYGRVVCDGNIVKDLYRWWFLSKCSAGKMSPYGRSWLEVS